MVINSERNDLICIYIRTYNYYVVVYSLSKRKRATKMNVLHHQPWVEESLEVKLPTIWTDRKAEVGRVGEEKKRREKIREEKESEERICRRAKR